MINESSRSPSRSMLSSVQGARQGVGGSTRFDPRAFLAAAKVPRTVAAGAFGLWTIYRQHIPWTDLRTRGRVGSDTLTVLAKMTEASMHKEYGDVVMEDSDQELLKHMPIWAVGRGRVLVSGLGLGCVVRGLLIKPEVERVDVVELDPGVLRAVGPEFDGDRRVRLHLGDALTYPWPEGATWDYAWHDVYVDEGNGVELHRLHMKLLVRFKERVRRQGAWALPRMIKRFLPGVLG